MVHVLRYLAWVLFYGASISVGSEPKQDSSRSHLPKEASSLLARYSIVQHDDRLWFADSQNRRFLSRGVCVVTRGATRDNFDPSRPEYAAWQHYANDESWAEATLTRLKTWRFTTVGAWSDLDVLRRSPDMSLQFTPVLHLGVTVGAPWLDMWDSQLVARMDALAKEQIMPLRGDSRLLGYYTDNELGWWNAELWKATLEHPATSGQRRQLLECLKQHYHQDWDALVVDFKPVGATNWSELEQEGMLWVQPGKQGVLVLRKFLAIVAERYYSLVSDVVRKYDSQALLLGDRYQSFYYPEVARAAAKHMDVVSTNLNASWSDGTHVRCYLDTLHRITDRPIIVSEMYVAARDNRSGNCNSHGVFPVVDTQPERAQSVRRTLDQLSELPYVVGVDWFQYCDEPTQGRADGENFNFGLVDIHDRPYDEVTQVHIQHADLGTARRRCAVPQGQQVVIPRAPRDPFAHWSPTHELENWSRVQGFIPCDTPLPTGDLYACWDDQSLYLGVYALDFAEKGAYQGGIVPTVDRAKWTVHIPGRDSPILARIGGGDEAWVNWSEVRVESPRDGSVRCIGCMRLPAHLFGSETFSPGQEVSWVSRLVTYGAASEMTWSTKVTLSMAVESALRRD